MNLLSCDASSLQNGFLLRATAFHAGIRLLPCCWTGCVPLAGSSAPPPPETTPMNANAQASSTIGDHAPAAPANAGSGLIVADADDVGQGVWLRLVDQLGSLHDPAALPGWPPPPSGNAAESCAHPGNSRPPGHCRTLRTSRTR